MQQHHTIVEVQDAARHALPQIAFRSRDGPESNSAKIVAADGIRHILDAMAIECVQDAVNFESIRGTRTASTWNELQEAALNILLILLGREPDDFADVRETIMQPEGEARRRGFWCIRIDQGSQQDRAQGVDAEGLQKSIHLR